ncbi:hypothetical protein [Labilithrix luteola]|nr:hypothetical protein [Labilithrix luteola]
MTRDRGLACLASMTLTLAHVVPARDHLPRFLASVSWGDAWRGFGACLAVFWFARWAASTVRRVPVLARATTFFVAGSLSLVGCGSSTTHGFDEDAGGSTAGASEPGAPSTSFGDGGSGGQPGPAPSDGPILLYAHTDKTLYSFDPNDLKSPTRIGDFDCIGSGAPAAAMTDIGVAKDGKLYGVSDTAAYPLTLKSGSVHCDATWPLPTNAHFYGLTMAPENTVAATETLIASNSAGQLFQIDATSGNPTQVGTLGTDPQSGKTWSLSGDIVFLANGGNPLGFATVRVCSGKGGTTCSSVDTLIEVDVKAIKPGTQSVLKTVRGQVVKGSWCTNPASPNTFGSMFGIAAFHDKVYGFSRKGDVVEIHNDDGSGCLVAAYASDPFAGAGVTTTAPVQAPPPK